MKIITTLFALFFLINVCKPSTIDSFSAADREEGVRILSMPASTSQNLVQSRQYAMSALGGQMVPTDRVNNPSAVHFIPIDGWQLWDGVQTTFHSWMGSEIITNSATVGQYGHRIVISSAGRSPVSQYRLRVTAPATAYGSFEIPVGTNTADGTEIQFNQNFVGLDFGPDRILNSFIDQTTHLWVQSGDDRVWMSGLPSTNHYDWWYRFGATLAFGISDVKGFNTLKSQFTTNTPSLTAELVTADRGVVATKVVTASVPKISIHRSSSGMRHLRISGGQTMLHHQIEGTASFTPPVIWSPINGGTIYHHGQEVEIATEGSMFFRALVVQ